MNLAVGLVIGEGFDGVFAAGHPGGIAGAEKGSAERDGRGACDPARGDEDGERGEAGEKSAADCVAEADPRGDADDAERGGFGEHRANDERAVRAERFQTPMSRVRSMTVVYMVRKITSRPMAMASAIIAWINVLSPGMFVAVISDRKSLSGRMV